MYRPVTIASLGLALSVAALAAPDAGDDAEQALAEQILQTMLRVHGTTAGHRPVHAKGLVCRGTFEPTAEAAALCKAPQFAGGAVPVTARLSQGAPSPAVADASPEAGPRGMAVRFSPPGVAETDVVAISHNGFVVSDGPEFLALQQAVVATDPAGPHPWPVEQFLASRPRALKFVQDNQAVPESLAAEAFFGNNAFVFVNKAAARQPVRLQILPVVPRRTLTDAERTSKGPDFLIEEMKARLAAGPVAYRLVAQLPNAGDPTHDPSLVWPEDRRTVTLGTITLTAALADSAAAEKELAFDPTNLAEGIEPSDDRMPGLRSRVYALSVMHRQEKTAK